MNLKWNGRVKVHVVSIGQKSVSLMIEYKPFDRDQWVKLGPFDVEARRTLSYELPFEVTFPKPDRIEGFAEIDTETMRPAAKTL